MLSPDEELPTLENYEILEEIGRGEYGSVRRVYDKQRDKFFAMKIVATPDSKGVPPSILKEIGILREIEHENIVTLHDVIFYPKKIFVIYELAKQDLRAKLAAPHKLSLDKIRSLMFQIFTGLTELHRQKILHRDLKPANILLFDAPKNGFFVAKLADFGLSKACGVPARELSSEVVTLWYRAPELLLGSRNYNDRIDVWSAGCVLAELIMAKPMFPGKDVESQLEKILEKIDFLSQEKECETLQKLERFFAMKELASKVKCEGFSCLGLHNEKCLALLKDCLELDPQRRPTAKQASEHPWFQPERDLRASLVPFF